MVTFEIPDSLAQELERLAEAEQKPWSVFVTELLSHDVIRYRQLRAIRLSAGAWNHQEHPELSEGGAAFVEALRSEPDERFEDAIRMNNMP